MVFIGFVFLSSAAIMKLFNGEVAPAWYIGLSTLALGFGFSFLWTPTTMGALSSISRNFAGIASGTFITIQEIGGNIGLVVTATLARINPSFTKGFHNAMWVLLFISLVIFRDSRRDIFFERKRFSLSKWYYLFPIVQIAVILFALFNVDFAAFSMRDIVLLIIATLTIGVNEELVTRGILLVGLRNSGMAEWKAWLGTIIVFSLLHLINVIAGGSLIVLVVVLTGGTIWYAARRIFNNLFVPIFLHALYDTAFFLLPGSYLVSESLPDHVLDIQLGSFLVLFLLSILFLVFGRKLFKAETVGWS